MNNKVQSAINTIVNSIVESQDFESLSDFILEHIHEFTDALQMIGDFDLENVMNASVFTLYKTCPPSMEEHVVACGSLYQHIIDVAWTEFNQDVTEAVSKAFDLEITEDAEDVAHLEKCFLI
jgi:hypothetical protein